MALVPGRTLRCPARVDAGFRDRFDRTTTGAESPHGERLGAGKVRRRIGLVMPSSLIGRARRRSAGNQIQGRQPLVRQPVFFTAIDVVLRWMFRRGVASGRIDSSNTQSQARHRRLWRSLYQPRRENSPGVPTVDRSILLAAVCASALVAASAASAKTLVFCSEGSPENFYPGVNTTGTSFDGNEPIYNRIVEFERGGTQVVPGLAEKWTISPDGTHLYLQPAQGREVAFDVQVVQADAGLQCRRRHVLDRTAMEGRQSVFQGDELEPFVFRRHGHAEIVEVGREGRRLHHQGRRSTSRKRLSSPTSRCPSRPSSRRNMRMQC